MITMLDQRFPDPDVLRGEGNEDHAIRKVTRSLAADPSSWTAERAANVGQLFDELAAGWNDRFSDGRMLSLDDALDRGELPSGGRVVELGCGTGFGTRVLAARFGPVVAMDLAFEMLRLAPPEAGARVHADASRLPLADGSVDVLVAVNMFLFPTEFARVLAPGGALVWVSSLAERTPIYLAASDVVDALPGPWRGLASRAGGGTWCVARRG